VAERIFAETKWTDKAVKESIERGIRLAIEVTRVELKIELEVLWDKLGLHSADVKKFRYLIEQHPKSSDNSTS